MAALLMNREGQITFCSLSRGERGRRGRIFLVRQGKKDGSHYPFLPATGRAKGKK